MSKCRRPYCSGTVLAGECLLCCRAPEGTTPEPLEIPERPRREHGTDRKLYHQERYRAKKKAREDSRQAEEGTAA